MDDLLAFLRARLDERELMLRTVSPAQIAWAMFRHADGSMRYTSVASSNGDAWVCAGCAVEPDSVQVVFDRAQELADVAARRQIIDLFVPCPDCLAGRRCIPHDSSAGLPGYWRFLDGDHERIARLLALPFAGHPAYRAEWKP